MQESARFRYAQARLQARHGARADDHTWRRVQGSGDLAGYLQTASQTALHAWTAGLHSGSSSHDIELRLRQQYRGYVREVAGWLPARWSGVVDAVALLPDLPALQHLIDGHSAPAWMREDPGLRPYTGEHRAGRSAALEQTDTAWLVAARQPGGSLPDTWYTHWRTLWPGAPRLTAGLAHLGRLLLGEIRDPHPADDLERRRERLSLALSAAFRRYAFQPAAACAHLGMIALDLQRLRADLADRALFTTRDGGQP
jgi:hypothetical protein